ncbi:MAG: hypothetical protein A3E81_02205 [Gammaproteobacteria bacterium RIFCSPHIGHO2_12_FULL_36_30]|nr:MAG: hypothetical protein A3E81_02205 [Gammaproteobacteria bacterium RIFCSPHIGHO2_12_FULL_36_30]
MKRILFLFFLIVNCSAILAEVHTPLVTKTIQKKFTPDDALQRLIRGNERFVNQKQHKIDFLEHAESTAQSQHPIAIILSCIDSRVPPEIIFDQNVGNIFVTRVAANVIDKDVLAGMEYATKVTGAKLIVVLGHGSCGAVKGACEKVELGHLTQLLNKIQPAISDATKTFGKKECNNSKFINAAAEDNVKRVVKLIPMQSPLIQELVKTDQVKIVGAMYHLRTGKVTFLK